MDKAFYLQALLEPIMDQSGVRTPPLQSGSTSAAAAATRPIGNALGHMPVPSAASFSLEERWPVANSADVEGQAAKFLRWADSSWPTVASQTVTASTVSTATTAAPPSTACLRCIPQDETFQQSPTSTAALLLPTATTETGGQAGKGCGDDDPLAVALAQEVGGFCRVPRATMDRLRAEFESREAELDVLRKQLRGQHAARSQFEKTRLLLRQLEDSCVVAENETVLWRQELEHAVADAEALQQKKAALQVQADEARLEAEHLESWVQAARSVLLPSTNLLQASGRVVQQHPQQTRHVFQQQHHLPRQQQQRRF